MDWQIISIDRFTECSSLWNEINEQGPHNPLLTAEFVGPAIEHYSTSRDLIAICRAATGPIAMGIFTSFGMGRWSTLQPVIAPLGLWVAHREVSIEPTLLGLFQKLPNVPVMISLRNQDSGIRKPPLETGKLSIIPYMETAAIHVDGQFSEYWKTRSGKFKYNVRARRNRLAERGINTHMELVTEPNDIEAAIFEYSKIEGAGWKGRTGTSLDQDITARLFYKNVLENYAKKGKTRIYRYLYNDKMVAADLCIQHDHELVVLKIVYDEEEAKTSPSVLLRQEEIEHAVDIENVNHLEFYGPLMDWHRAWATEIRSMYHINCYRYGFLKSLHERTRKGLVQELDDRNSDFEFNARAKHAR